MPSANQNKGPVTQYVPVTVAQGIETKIDPNLVQPPKGLQADNVRLTTLGAHRKRFGQVKIPSVGSGNVNVASTQKQLIALNNNTLSAYDFDDAVWIQGSPYPVLNAVEANSLSITSLGTQPTAPSNLFGLNNPSVAYIGDVGIFCYDSRTAPGVFAIDTINIVCFDINSGQVFWSRQMGQAQRNVGSKGYYLFNHGASTPSSISVPYGLSNVQVIACGGQFVLTFLETGKLTTSSYQPVAQLMRCFTFAPSRTAAINLYFGTNCTQLDSYAFPTYWATTSATYLNAPAINYCAARNPTDFTLAINGTNNGTDSNSQIAAVISNAIPLTQSSTCVSLYQTVTGGGATLSPIICGMSDTLTCSVLALSTGAYVVQTASGTLSGFSSFTTWNGMSALATPFDIRVKSTGTTTFTYTASDGLQILSGTGSGIAALTQNTYQPLMLYMASSGQATLGSQIVTYNSAPCAWIILGNVNATPADPFLSLVFVNLLTFEVIARAFYLQVSYAGGARAPSAFLLNGQPTALLIQAAEDAVDNLQFAKLVTVVPGQNQVIRTPDGAIITGADTKYYDNQLVRSAGWLKVPEVTVTPNTSGSGNLTTGATYSVIVVLADFDAAGNAIYSCPSTPYSVVLSGGAKSYSVALTNVYPNFLPSTTGPVVYIYRTSVTNPISYYLVGSLYMTGGQPTAFVDLTMDDNTKNAELYSQPAGGEQPNDPAPPSTCGVATKTRMFLAGAERGSALYFSKPFFYGRAPEFNYGNVLDIEPSTGPIVGLGALDDVVVIFKSSYIYLLSGQGPDATGSGVFSDIANISTDRGLVDKNSIVLTNDGLYFRSQRGIELLDRSYNISYVGQSVEGLLKGASIVSAVSVPAESQVRFALSTGQTIVYDYTAQGWTTYTYNLSSVTGTPITSSQTLFNGVPYSATNGTNGGQIYAEGANTFLDDSNLYPYTVQSAHMPLAGPQGWGRVRRCNILGVTTSIPSRISVKFVYDYDSSNPSSPITYDIAQPGPFNIRVRAPRQVAQAVSVIVQNVTSSGTGEGSYITGIVLETSQKSGALRLPDSQSV